jgi:hypothetical protein
MRRAIGSVSWEGQIATSEGLCVDIGSMCTIITLKAQEKPPLKLITTTPMPGFTGDFDHFGLDLKGNRLFLAAEEHKTVEVFDLRTGARTHSIEGFADPLMMVYLPESNQLVVTDGDDSAVYLVDCTQYKIIKTIKLSPDVDHGTRITARNGPFSTNSTGVLNPVNKYYYVESGGGSNAPTHVLSIIDTTSVKTCRRGGGTARKLQRGDGHRPRECRPPIGPNRQFLYPN